MQVKDGFLQISEAEKKIFSSKNKMGFGKVKSPISTFEITNKVNIV